MNIELTEATINNSIKTCNSSCLLRDSILTGFGVRIYPSGKVSYIIEPTVNGSTKRRVIGKYPAISVNKARELAKERILQLTAQPPLPAATFPTLSLAYKDYITQIQLKPLSISEYNVVVRCYLSTLSNTPLDEITEDMVIKLYLHSCNRSISQANKAMKILQAVIRFSGVVNNPVAVLARRRMLRQLKPRTSYIPLIDLTLFYKGLKKVKYSHVRLYLELLLHTGLRASEGLQVTSSSVTTGTLIITETKNHTDHQIPLTQWLTDNLLPFLEHNPDGFKSADIRKSLHTACQYLPYTVTRHDLRRTFASYASEAGCDYLLIKRALNHSVSDITARYIQTSPNGLKPVFDRVADLIESQLEAMS
jgi:integrase